MAYPTVSTKSPAQRTAQTDPYTGPQAGFVCYRHDFETIPGLSTQRDGFSPKSSGRHINQ